MSRSRIPGCLSIRDLQLALKPQTFLNFKVSDSQQSFRSIPIFGNLDLYETLYDHQ
jgi:hypothetical protein